MNENEIKEFVYQTLSDVLDDCDIDDATLLFEDEILDSISILYLVSELEDKYSVQIPIEDIIEENFKSINHIVSYMTSIITDKKEA